MTAGAGVTVTRTADRRGSGAKAGSEVAFSRTDQPGSPPARLLESRNGSPRTRLSGEASAGRQCVGAGGRARAHIYTVNRTHDHALTPAGGPPRTSRPNGERALDAGDRSTPTARKTAVAGVSGHDMPASRGGAPSSSAPQPVGGVVPVERRMAPNSGDEPGGSERVDLGVRGRPHRGGGDTAWLTGSAARDASGDAVPGSLVVRSRAGLSTSCSWSPSCWHSLGWAGSGSRMRLVRHPTPTEPSCLGQLTPDRALPVPGRVGRARASSCAAAWRSTPRRPDPWRRSLPR